MDGQFDKLEELIYVESHLSNTSAKFYGEITQQMLKNSSFPGSNNGTGLLQTIIGLKVGTHGCAGGAGGGVADTGGARSRPGETWMAVRPGGQMGGARSSAVQSQWGARRPNCRLLGTAAARTMAGGTHSLWQITPPNPRRQVREVYERITSETVVPAAAN